MTSLPRKEGAAQAAPLSNFLAAKAEDVRSGLAIFRAGSLELATVYINVCAAMAEARAEAKHGEWAAFLRRAGVGQSTARAMIQFSKAGVTPARLADIGVMAIRRELANAGRPAKPLSDSGLEGEPATPGAGAAPDVQGPAPSTLPAPPPPAPAPELPAPPPSTRYRRRRETGACTDCGAAAPDGRSRCETCAAAISIRRRRRRALAGVGEVVFETGAQGRIVKAAAAGRPATLTKAETAALAAALAKGPPAPSGAGADAKGGAGRARGREGKGR